MKLGDSLINSYFNLINGDSIPFEGGDKKVLFEIFLYSNLKDIYKSPKMKEIFLYNTQYISECFEYDEGKSEINNVINNRLINELRINKLENAFSKYELINDFHPFILASFFYLIINKMKEKGKNMYNFYNPLMIKILKNVFNNFFMYCYHKNYTNETYTFLFNYFNKLVIQNESDKINKKYEYENIKEKINKSNEFKKELRKLEENIEKDEKSKIDLKTLNNIKLIPLTKKRTSHTITILISGFLSQHDNIDTWSHFYNYEKEYSVYYMLKWPSSYILSFILKILGSLFNPESTFISSYKIAEHVGKILAWFLINNDDFDDCNINLVGFSLGCHIIINCLTELNKFKNKKFVLNNVLLMGGATYIDDYERYKWRKIFSDNVAGNIINCWSEHDDVLSTLFKRCIRKTPIGSKKIDIKDERGEYSIVDDYEFSDIELGHLNYRKKFEKILKRIHFFD